MRISLIGMSGSGKTYWSKQLEKKGFKCFSVDDLIEKKLEEDLTKHGYKGITDVAKWMGYPYEKKYKAASKRYLDLEKQVMREILNFLKNEAKTDENIVIDTSGSVIYTKASVLKELSQLTYIVYFKIPESGIREIYKLFLDDPKPLIWGNIFSRKSGEAEMEALQRSYPLLLEYRAKQYEKIAHMDINHSQFRKDDFTPENFLESVKSVPNLFHDQIS